MALICKNLSEESIKNLRRLQGEFLPPRSRVLLMRASSVLQAGLGCFCGWIFVQRMQALPPSFPMSSHRGIGVIRAGVYGAALLIGGAWSWWKAGRGYRFGSGMVQGLSNSGAVVWTEDVLGIVSGTISHDYGGKAAFMTLQLANSKRRIDIVPSLAEALKALEPKSVSEPPIDLRAAVEASGTEPVGPSWSCRSCGEENPGNFEECWKCQAVRDGASK